MEHLSDRCDMFSDRFDELRDQIDNLHDELDELDDYFNGRLSKVRTIETFENFSFAIMYYSI